jgi:hypothetical protein
MADKRGLALTEIEGIPAATTARLAELWITTAEELVSAARAENGVAELAAFLGADAAQVSDWVDLALNRLPADITFDSEPGERFGLGALDEPTDEEPSARLSFAPLPPKADLRAGMPEIRNQGGRGTCVSFACTAVREYLLGSPGDLSEQFLYWACKQHDGYPGSGTYIQVGMERLLEQGECGEPDWPYNPVPIAGNEGQDPPPPNAVTRAQSYRISATRKIPARSVDELREALAGNQPVAFAVPVFTYWFTEPVRSGGDIRLPLASDHQEGGHAMCMVGYEDDPSVPGGGYFVIRNSWGTHWASHSSVAAGYARLPYDYIRQYATAAHTASAGPAPVPQPVNFWTRLLTFLRRLFGG